MEQMRVLLVDDEDELVFTMAERLTMRGYEVDAVTSGDAALERLGANVYDVAVVDVKMPGTSGQEVLRVARELRPEMPVILLTGHGSTEEGEEGMRLGACAYLFKPVNIEELMKTMEECGQGAVDE
jgi:DNA-binding response OmpR family regulator